MLLLLIFSPKYEHNNITKIAYSNIPNSTWLLKYLLYIYEYEYDVLQAVLPVYTTTT